MSLHFHVIAVRIIIFIFFCNSVISTKHAALEEKDAEIERLRKENEMLANEIERRRQYAVDKVELRKKCMLFVSLFSIR